MADYEAISLEQIIKKGVCQRPADPEGGIVRCMTRGCQQLGITAGSAVVAGSEAPAALLQVTLHYYTAALLLQCRRKLTNLTLLQRQQKDCAVDRFAYKFRYETDLRAQATNQQHHESDLATAPRYGTLNTPCPGD